MRTEPDELEGADRCRLVRGTDDHGGAVGQVGEEPGGLVEHLLDLAVGVVEELADLLSADRVERAGAAQVVDEEAVALVGRDAAGAGMGLDEEAFPLERGHVGADGGRRHAHSGCVDDVLGTDGLGGADVLGHHSVEDRRLAVVEPFGERGGRRAAGVFRGPRLVLAGHRLVAAPGRVAVPGPVATVSRNGVGTPL